MQLVSAFFGPGSNIVQRRTLDRVEVENAVRRAMTDVSFSFIVIHVSKEKTASFIIEKRLFTSHLFYLCNCRFMDNLQTMLLASSVSI